MRRKIIIFLLSVISIVCLAFGLAACGGTGSNSSSNSSNSSNQAQTSNNGDNSSSTGEESNTSAATTYTVTYDANGGTFADGGDTYTQTVNSGSTLTAPTSPTRESCTFAGWTTSKNGSVMWSFSSDTVTTNITLYASWNEKSASILSVENASIDGTDIFMLVDNTTDSVSLSSKVVCSSDSTWKLYYDKLGQTEIPTKIAASTTGSLYNGENLFYMVVTSTDSTQVNVYTLTVYRSYAVTVGYYNGDGLLKTETAYTGYSFNTSYTPTISGYTFNYWKTSSGSMFTEETLWSALALYADTTVNSYTVTYNVNGGDELTTTTKTVIYDSSYTLSVPTRTGYTFNGWYYGSNQLTDGEGKSIDVWSYASDTTVTAKWAANNYKVTLLLSDNSAGSVSGDGNHAYDSNVTIKAINNDGYTFVGWYDSNDELVTTNLSYTFTMGFNVSYTAKWTYYTLTTSVNDSSAGSVSSYSNTKVTVGNSVTIEATTKSGYTWVGWYDKNDELITTNLSYTLNMPAENLSFTAKWTYYTLTTSINNSSAGSITSYSDTKVTAGNSITIIATNNMGYTFAGWYDGDEQLTLELSYTFAMPAETVTYTAKYEVNPDMTNFIFNSTATTCQITGLKDYTVTEIIVPNYVTSISSGAFSGCANLISITLPFVGATARTSSNTYQFPLGYIFGTSSYTGGTATEQYYYGSSTSSTTYSTYYIPTTLTTVIITGGNILYGAFYSCVSLTSITIPDSVTSIGDYAFNNCRALESITIPNSVTSIGSYAFRNCTSLISVTIPDSVTSIGSYAFRYCTTEIIWGDSTTIAEIGSYAFAYYKGSSIIIPDSVTSIGDYAFYGCTLLTIVYYSGTASQWASISFGNYTANPLYYAGNLYINEKLLSELKNTDITSISAYAFSGWNVTSITIPENVTSIDSYAFSGCSALTEINFNATAMDDFSSSPRFSNAGQNGDGITVTIGANVTKIPANLFLSNSSNNNITSVIFEDNSKCASIGNYAFYCCISLTSITIPESVTSIGSYAFSGCSALTEINFDAVAMDDLSSSNYVFSNAGQNGDGITVTIGASVTKIPACLFCPTSSTGNAPKIISVVFEEGSVCESIGASAFFVCASITSIYYNGTASKWASISFHGMYANPLYYAGNLYLNGNLVIDIAIEGITDINAYAFYGCTSLVSITISDSVTSIGSSAFGGCSSLESISLPFVGGSAKATSASSSTLFGYIFGPSSYTSGISTKQFYAGGSYETYYIPSKLTTVTITGGEILYGSFYNCTSIERLTLSSGVTSIGIDVFDGCTSLTSISLPDSITSIGIAAFYGCTSLTSVTIGKNVTSIGSQAFYRCYKLIEVYNLSSLTIIAGNTDNGYVGYYAKNVYMLESGSSYLTTQDDYIFYNDNETYYLMGYTGNDSILTLPTLTINSERVNYSIYQYAFYKNTRITSVIIGDSVTSIGSSAFDGCTSLTSVYYCGTADEWSAITFSNNTSDPTYYGATRYYYNASEPDYTDGYNYWHYVDGEIVVWVQSTED